MNATRLELSGLILISPAIYRDERGFFMERFNLELFSEFGLPTHFYQDNHSRSLPGVLRGLHFQHNPAQGKLVGVTRGEIWDVVVDLRADSPTFGKSLATRLSEKNGQLLWVPAGFAHGFCVLGSEPADVFYKTDAPYQPAGEGGIRWNDPDLAIAWPIHNPLLSERDQRLSAFADYRRKAINWDEQILMGKGDESFAVVEP